MNSGCARKPGAISEADGSNAVDASDAKTLANEDKPVGSTTASDAASSLIALSQEENSKVGGSQEDAENASEAKKLANVDTAEGSNTARDASPDSIAPNEEENSKVGGVHKDALVVNEDKDDGSTTAGDSAPALIAPSQQGNSKVGGNQEDGNTGRPSDQENNEASIALLLSDYIPQVTESLPIAFEVTTKATERSKEGSCSETDPPEVALVANPKQAGPLTATEIIDHIRSLSNMREDADEFANNCEYFGHALVDLFATSEQMDTIVPDMEECLNLLRKGTFESEAVGQGMTLCCTHISLMYAHFFYCKEIRDQINAGTPDDICKYLAKEYQFMIQKGKECYMTIMNILNYGKKRKVTMPTIDEIFKLLNESMPNQQLVIPRSDTADSPDLNEIALESFTWYDVGEIILMLQRFEIDAKSSVLGKLGSYFRHNCCT